MLRVRLARTGLAGTGKGMLRVRLAQELTMVAMVAMAARCFGGSRRRRALRSEGKGQGGVGSEGRVLERLPIGTGA
jgi:hypothetical protein